MRFARLFLSVNSPLRLIVSGAGKAFLDHSITERGPPPQ
jgi:hypothetical protein